ncbi:hypothetical protein N7541_011875 [Penicillium brevicompactum]|uniref:Uncharacterized protein n=1 Tax=Penicillium brevicompactum TaxID=5074 RepID=A0A9W9QR65_PENBR|nr:hypothetical protein N7541_011875 [Penicillium brevicompactum]
MPAGEEVCKLDKSPRWPVDNKQLGESREADNPFAKPIDTGNRMKDDIIDVQARTVLLDSEGNAVGDWYQDEEVPAVFLQFSFLNNTYENRIDVRIAHYRAKGSNKYAPSAENLFFRVYADQVRALKRWLIVEVQPPIHSTFGSSQPADSEFKPASPGSPPAFTEVIVNLTDESETTPPPLSLKCTT